MKRWRPHLLTVLEVGLGLAFYLQRRRRRRDNRSRQEVIAQRARESMADFMQHGPRLWAGRQCYVLARSSDDKRVLLGGVGGMGIGRMCPIAPGDAGRYSRDVTYLDAPVDDDALDDFGEDGRGQRQGWPRPAGLG